MDKVIGIDISKLTFDVSFSNKDQEVYDNTVKGFKKFLKKINKESNVFMEASGPYYVELAEFLNEKNINVFVENPLKIKRFSQMNFNRAKTDKKDAELIRKYGSLIGDDLKQWSPEPDTIKSLKQLNSCVELLDKQINQTSNQLGAFVDSGYVCKELSESLLSLLEKLKTDKKLLENKMAEIVKKNYKETLVLLTSIPGIGIKTASLLIAITNDFAKFEHYKQLIAFIGLSPRIYQSGTSVNGKGAICKMGNSKMRKLLYLCSLSALQHNKTCREMNIRLEKKGKNHRVRKIAIANKLVKQAFSVVINKIEYNKNYVPKVCF